MTTIAFRAGKMAADRRCTSDGAHQAERTKVEVIGGWLLGISGDLMHCSTLRALLSERLEKDTFAEGIVGKFEWADDNHMAAILVSPRHEVYFIENTKAGVVAAAKMGASNGFVARGSGRDFALAAMAMGASAYEAVEIAARFDASTGDGIDEISLSAIAALEPAPAEPEAEPVAADQMFAGVPAWANERWQQDAHLRSFIVDESAVFHDGGPMPVSNNAIVDIYFDGDLLRDKLAEDYDWIDFECAYRVVMQPAGELYEDPTVDAIAEYIERETHTDDVQPADPEPTELDDQPQTSRRTEVGT